MMYSRQAVISILPDKALEDTGAFEVLKAADYLANWAEGGDPTDLFSFLLLDNDALSIYSEIEMREHLISGKDIGQCQRW